MILFGYRIAVTKVKKRKVSTGHSAKRWTNAETNKALEWSGEGMSNREISSKLNRTPASVTARLWKVRKK